MRTIRVTGKGQIRLRPDTTRITMTLEGLYPDYGETLRRSAEDTEILKDLLFGFGFDRSELKTLQFGVDTEYEGYQDANGVYRNRFAGYRFRHSLKIDFPSDRERLGKVLYGLANGTIRPELRLSYTVKDPEAAKNELLGKAVADARTKATVLAQAGALSLGEIQSIDYSWSERSLEVQPMNRMLMAGKGASAEASYDLSIEPDDIELSDTVMVVWEIS